MQYLKIPKERVAVLIGKQGEVKREIERRSGSKIEVRDEEVVVAGNPMVELMVLDVIKAIGRGFSPEKAFKLLDEENTLKIISLKDFCNTEKALKRRKGRIIGEKGKSKRVIEELTETYLSIYGKTVAIIGGYDGVEIALEAVLRILKGAPHSTVYKFLERKAPALRESRV